MQQKNTINELLSPKQTLYAGPWQILFKNATVQKLTDMNKAWIESDMKMFICVFKSLNY